MAEHLDIDDAMMGDDEDHVARQIVPDDAHQVAGVVWDDEHLDLAEWDEEWDGIDRQEALRFTRIVARAQRIAARDISLRAIEDSRLRALRVIERERRARAQRVIVMCLGVAPNLPALPQPLRWRIAELAVVQLRREICELN